MPRGFEDLLDLIKEGKIEEARSLVDAQKAKLRYSPDTIRVVKGKARFTKKGEARRAWR